MTADAPVALVETTTRAVRLNLELVDVDIRDSKTLSRSAGEFLEGIDIAGEEAFEEWLREIRNNIADISTASEGGKTVREKEARGSRS